MKNNWPTKRLDELCCIFADGDWIEKKDQAPDGIRLVQTGNIGNGIYKDRGEKARYITKETFKRLRCTEVFPGDCLISRLPDPVGRACIIPNTEEKMITAVDCSILRFNKGLIRKSWFVYFTLSQGYQQQINSMVSGATRQRISRNNLGLIQIPLPSLTEQRRIVAKLDKAFAAIAKAKENAEKNLANSKELFESYLNGVFAKPGKGCVKKRLEELGQITSSKRIYKKEYVKEGIPFYRIKEVKELANNKEISTDLYITESRYLEIKKSFGVPKAGDLLVTAVGTIGEIYIVKKNERFYFKDGNVLWLKNYAFVNPYFLKLILQSFVEKIKKLSIGSAYNALTIEKLEKHEIFVPPLTKQKIIVAKLNSLSAQTKKLEAIYTQKLADLEELKKSVLQMAFAGEL